MLNAAYFLPIVFRAFFRAPAGHEQKSGEAPLPIVAALTVTAAGTVLMFFSPGIHYALAQLMIGR